uniref:Uncharacterized protein n=1 Tax=Tetradesmus obliquus TaxID=3088 RepID=A0A383V5N0_TETOB|eukprot:jgi/Sobl393_1/8700/SZX60915.1
METVRARDQGPVAAEGRNPIKAAMRAVGIGAGAPAGEHDDTVVRDADAAHHEALAREAEVGPAVEGKEQLLQEREWDRHGSKQGRRDLPAEVVEKHPSLASADTTLPTPPTTTTATTTAGSDSAACATCGISRNITSSTTDNACPACGPRGNTSAANIDTYIDGSSSSSSAITGLQHNHPLMGLSDECGLCAAPPGALEAEREALLGKAAELEQERAAHAAAAAEAKAMRARAAARAAELEARLRTDFTSRRQTLLQQQEAASAELSRLNATRAGVVQRVHSLEGQLGRLVDEEAALLQQRAEAERLRLEIESARDGIVARAAELASLTSGLGQQQQQAAAAVAAAAAALAEREAEVAAAAERLTLLQTQAVEARETLAAAEVMREQVSAELAAAETDLVTQQRQVDALELKLPDLNSQHAQYMARQEQLRQQAAALNADMESVQAEAERVAREKEEKEHEGAFSAERLASIDARASQLSCQAAALQAKAAGAEGLQVAEQARAQAAEAEAHGLQIAAETLGSGKAAMLKSSVATTTNTSSSTAATSATTRHTSTASPQVTAADFGGFPTHHAASTTGSHVEEQAQREFTSGSSSGARGDRAVAGGELHVYMQAPERDVLAELEPSSLAGVEGVRSEGATEMAEGSAVHGLGRRGEGVVQHGRIAFEEREMAPAAAGLRQEEEEGEGYAPMPRPSVAAPIGGAVLPTQEGFAAPKTAESEIGATAGHEGATSGATLGTLQGGLQPGYAGDASESPRKSGKGMLGNLKSMLSPRK